MRYIGDTAQHDLMRLEGSSYQPADPVEHQELIETSSLEDLLIFSFHMIRPRARTWGAANLKFVNRIIIIYSITVRATANLITEH